VHQECPNHDTAKLLLNSVSTIDHCQDQNNSNINHTINLTSEILAVYGQQTADQAGSGALASHHTSNTPSSLLAPQNSYPGAQFSQS